MDITYKISQIFPFAKVVILKIKFLTDPRFKFFIQADDAKDFISNRSLLPNIR